MFQQSREQIALRGSRQTNRPSDIRSTAMYFYSLARVLVQLKNSFSGSLQRQKSQKLATTRKLATPPSVARSRLVATLLAS